MMGKLEDDRASEILVSDRLPVKDGSYWVRFKGYANMNGCMFKDGKFQTTLEVYSWKAHEHLGSLSKGKGRHW
jgi:hypothetical protein